MKNIDISFLQAELVRVSNWIEFADKKAGFLGAFYSAVAGFILTKYSSILCGFLFYEGTYFIAFIFAIIFLLGSFGIGVYFLYRTVLPQLENNHTNNSLFYFGNVAKKKITDYLQEMNELSWERVTREISEQIYTNSLIANKKMSNVQKSTRTLFVTIAALAIFNIFI